MKELPSTDLGRCSLSLPYLATQNFSDDVTNSPYTTLVLRTSPVMRHLESTLPRRYQIYKCSGAITLWAGQSPVYYIRSSELLPSYHLERSCS